MIPKTTFPIYKIATFALAILSAVLIYNQYGTGGTGGTSYCDLRCDNFEEVEPNVQELSFVKTLVDNYKANQLRYIKNGFASDGVTNDVDAQSVWFSIKELKNFIYNIEKKWENNCEADCNNLGVRFYYGAYPSDISAFSSTDMGNVPKNFNYLHTLVMVPTYNVGTENIDFSTDNFNSNCTPTDMMSLLCNSTTSSTARSQNQNTMQSTGVAKPKIMALIGGINSLAKKEVKSDNKNARTIEPVGGGIQPTTVFNHGGLCPPPFYKAWYTDALFLNDCDKMPTGR